MARVVKVFLKRSGLSFSRGGSFKRVECFRSCVSISAAVKDGSFVSDEPVF
jgi:hypothetical protein